MSKILTIIGARPQFIKASVVSNALRDMEGVEELILHTGQHFDDNMSDIFFGQLDIPKPTVQLGINGGAHGQMTGRMLEQIEAEIIEHSPERVLVYGDTNSTLAGSLAASKLHIPVSHVEAGLRSFNMKMPEEINRILTDQLSSQLFCPTDIAVNNLQQEGFNLKDVEILKVGDVMQDASLFFKTKAVPPKSLAPREGFILATLHRAENTDNPERLKSIVNALNHINRYLAPIIMPLHPRTRNYLSHLDLKVNFEVQPPVGYLEMLWLLDNCELVLTDSGGVQKEAFFFQKACVTMRDQTEWIELIQNGVNELVGADLDGIISSAQRNYGRRVNDKEGLYGGGIAALKVAKHLS